MVTWIWLAVIVLAVVVEAAGPQLICIWFAFGGLAGLIASLLHASLPVQIVLFIVFTALGLILTKPIAKKLQNKKSSATNADRYIGMSGIVVERIDSLSATGRVKVGAMDWAAVSSDGTTIEKGSTVIVTKLEGVKLEVKSVN